jgi:hypothetical protein
LLGGSDSYMPRPPIMPGEHFNPAEAAPVQMPEASGTIVGASA